MILLSNSYLMAQSTQDYFLKIKQGHDLGAIQKTTNIDSTLTLSFANSDLKNILNSKTIYKFEKPFPNLNSAFLDLVYLITIDDTESTTDITSRNEVQYLELIEDDIQLTEDFSQPYAIVPNDYIDVLLGGRNTALDLIKAPLAWTIATGENVLVGVADTKVDLNHFDMPVIQEINQPITNTDKHGTGVVGMIAAKTNNGLGIASLAHNASIVSAPRLGYQAVYALSQTPGVKVINCSWRSNCSYSQTLDELYAAIADIGILVVASAANGPNSNSSCGDGHGYAYPASYNSTLSVTSVGERVPIGVVDDGVPGETMSWIDVHRFRPDIPGNTSSHTHNDKVDVCAPGINTLILTDEYDVYPDGYRRGIGTSISAPIVSALGALIFSVNPNLTAYQVKDIIKSTADDIYYIPYNQPYIGQLGTGRINAYRAVKTAQCMLNPGGGLDLAMQNSNLDMFEEPDVESEILWQSEDIWVRNQNDGNLIKVHENPEYGSGPNYVYVRVTNNSCVTSSGSDTLNLYWSKANTALTWPNHWDGSLYIEDPVTNEGILMGDQIGSLSIPVLGPGESKILEFPWNVPNPDDYKNINFIPWSFSFLARIESLDDPIPPIISTSLPHLVKSSNNIIWKNTTVVDLIPNLSTDIASAVGIGNPYNTPHAFNLEFKIDDHETGKPIYEEAEVSVQMDNILFNAWQNGGNSATYADSTNISNKKIISANNAQLSNIQFAANEIGTLSIKFNFLTKEVTDKKKYTLYVMQRDAVTNELVGGETYIINKIPRPVFTANAGNDETIDRSESVTISAAQITEAAIYNWYDSEGNFIYTGTDLTVAPDVTKKYKLEIISDIDGYKDYDEVEVTVNPYHLESLVPNPALNQVTVNYIADEAASAYLMVVNTTSGVSDNYIVDTALNSIVLDISNYTSGTYSVALVCDGQIQDSKNLLKQ